MAKESEQTPTPGQAIERALAERGWTHDDLAEALKKHRPLVTSLISGKRGVTPDLAVRLAAALGGTPAEWMRLEAAKQLALIPDVAEDVARSARLLDLAPVKEMERRGWIRPTTNAGALEAELKRFFDVDSLEEDPPILASARKANPDEPMNREQRAWIARARQLASAHPARPYREENAEAMVAKLRRLAAFPRESAAVCDVLFDFGVRFVVVQPLERSRIDGAAFWIGESPAIALSLRHGRIDAFWFTLMHEVAHILHRDEGSIDSDLAGKEQIPSRMKAEAERRADEAAAAMLIKPEELSEFVRMFSPLYSKTRIAQFANKIKLHPGIILGQLQHRAELGWDAGRGMLVDVREYVTSTALTDGWGKTISPGTLD